MTWCGSCDKKSGGSDAHGIGQWQLGEFAHIQRYATICHEAKCVFLLYGAFGFICGIYTFQWSNGPITGKNVPRNHYCRERVIINDFIVPKWFAHHRFNRYVNLFFFPTNRDFICETSEPDPRFGYLEKNARTAGSLNGVGQLGWLSLETPWCRMISRPFKPMQNFLLPCGWGKSFCLSCRPSCGKQMCFMG